MDNKQEKFQKLLMGVGTGGVKYTVQDYARLSMQDLITLYHMAATFQRNIKDAKKKLFYANRVLFFENQIIEKLWSLEKCYTLVVKDSGKLYTEALKKTEDILAFIFSEESIAKTATESRGVGAVKPVYKEIDHGQFPQFYLNLFTKGVTAITIDIAQSTIVIPLWAVCSRLREDVVHEESRPAFHIWIKREIYVIYSSLTKLPYVVCDPETFDDQIYVYNTEKAAETAKLKLVEMGEPVYVECLRNRRFYQCFFHLYLMGVNAVCSEKDGTIQLTKLIPKPDASRLPEEQRPILNPELTLTAVYMCQEERKPEADRKEEDLSLMREELMTHLRESTLAVPALPLQEGDDPKKVQFPVLTLTTGEKYCPVFTDLWTAKEYENSRMKKASEEGTETTTLSYRYLKLGFDRVMQLLPQEIKGVIMNPSTIQLVLKRTKQEGK